MSKDLTKETSLFAGNRRETELTSWLVLQSRGREKRMKFSVRMPLSNRPLVAMPDWIAISYEAMHKDGSAQSSGKLSRMLEGMTWEIFSTPERREPVLSLTGTTVKDLALLKDGDEEDGEIYLYATIYAPANVKARDWAWETLRGTFYGSFEYSQSELAFDGNKDEPANLEDETDAEANENYMGAEHDSSFASTPAPVSKSQAKRRRSQNAHA